MSRTQDELDRFAVTYRNAPQTQPFYEQDAQLPPNAFKPVIGMLKAVAEQYGVDAYDKAFIVGVLSSMSLIAAMEDSRQAFSQLTGNDSEDGADAAILLHTISEAVCRLHLQEDGRQEERSPWKKNN